MPKSLRTKLLTRSRTLSHFLIQSPHGEPFFKNRSHIPYLGHVENGTDYNNLPRLEPSRALLAMARKPSMAPMWDLPTTLARPDGGLCMVGPPCRINHWAAPCFTEDNGYDDDGDRELPATLVRVFAGELVRHFELELAAHKRAKALGLDDLMPKVLFAGLTLPPPIEAMQNRKRRRERDGLIEDLQPVMITEFPGERKALWTLEEAERCWESYSRLWARRIVHGNVDKHNVRFGEMSSGFVRCWLFNWEEALYDVEDWRIRREMEQVENLCEWMTEKVFVYESGEKHIQSRE
ncbi:hypothetical protein HK101_008984 [Irineochytrium annulatum]|nr:hypothetical protein HK101_008984 [Irineochytrium annulatum]